MTSELLRELLSPGAMTYRRFLEEWFGPSRAGFGVPAHELPPLIPAALSGFYEHAGRRPGVFGFNRLYAPDELRADESGRIVFCSENQGVCVWATAGACDDPEVQIKGSLQIDPDGREWHRESEPLSRFLLQLVLFEAAMGATFGGSALAQPKEALDRILEPLTCLPLAPWLWPVSESRFWAGDDVVALVSPDPDSDTKEVLIGARSAAPLGHLRQLPPHVWETLILSEDERNTV